MAMPPATGVGIFARAFVRELRFLRDNRWDLALSTVLPVVLLALMGALFSGGTPRDLPVVLVDQDHSSFSREAARMFDAAPGIAIAFSKDDPAAAWPIVRRGQALGVVLVPKNAEREVKAGRPATLFLYTASSYYTASATLQREAGSVVSALAGRYAKSDTAKIALSRVRPPPVAVQTTTLYNPNLSYEWMLVGPIHAAVIIILLSAAVMTSAGREFSHRTFSEWMTQRGVFAALTGKLILYVAIYFIYGVVCFVWLAWGRGYPITGSVGVLLLGYVLMLIAYAYLGALIVSTVRDAAMALGAAAVYASSAMAFSGAFFPMRGANLFAQSWNAVQPYTWFVQISMQTWQMGAPASVSAKALTVLGVIVLFCGCGAWAGYKLAAHEAGKGAL